jgi:hypothetical protein
VVVNRALCVHSAAIWLTIAWIDALTSDANLLLLAFRIRRTKRLAYRSTTIRVTQTVGVLLTRNWDWLAAVDAVFRISAISIATDTRARMVFGTTLSIDSTSHSSADVTTLWNVVLLNTFRRLWTIVVDLTLDGLLTANCVRVADFSSLAGAFVGAAGVSAFCSRSAWIALAEIDDVTLNFRITAITWDALTGCGVNEDREIV